MPESSPILSLPYIQPSQAQKHVTHNEAIRVLDAIVQAVAIDDALDAPPGVAADGDAYIVGPGASGAWAGRAGAIAVLADGGWEFVTPKAGWRVHVLARQDEVVFDGSGWVAPEARVLGAAQVGISATPDDANRLAVASAGSLFSHAGQGHQLKINKAGLSDTASLLFQTNWSGRAEMGTAGSDAFEIKVSPDGVNWTTTLRAVPSNGKIFARGVTGGMSAIHTQKSIVGDVTGGAVIERGATAEGEFVRFVDGTLICTHKVTTDTAGAVSWTYPSPFAPGAAVVSATVEDAVPSVAQVTNVAETGAEVHGFAVADGSRVAVTVHLTATGRWI